VDAKEDLKLAYIFGRQKLLKGSTGMAKPEENASSDFIRTIITEDIQNGKNKGRVATRFPPEPNGYLHIGHAKSICLNFGIARDYAGGTCNLRFDDTNPAKEETEYVESITADVRWLGFDWQDRLYYASDYFDQLYNYAEQLILKGKAYVCSLSADEIREFRGTLTEPGKDSPYRNRTIQENLDLFKRMRAGEFADGAHVLRAKIDMASPNLNLRDPTLYRIKHLLHHRTGDQWCMYPMYDFAHCLSDSIEGITHSICTLEFENNRPLYDWILDALETACHPRQIEFARLNLTFTVLSKRRLIALVTGGHVDGWDDPRMPTLSGMRRRGYPPRAIVNFCERIGVAKRDSMVDIALLEFCVREELNKRAPRVMGVLNPLRVVIENYPEGRTEMLEAVNNPEDPDMGTRKIPFSREIYIEREDFMEDPPKKFYRLAPGREVRLRYAYFLNCTGVVKDDRTGEIKALRCTYDPQTKGGDAPDGRKVKATLHWVSAAHAIDAKIRVYDHLFTQEVPGSGSEAKDFLMDLNPGSLKELTRAKLEPGLADAAPGDVFQFERLGYFCVDHRLSKPGAPVFNRTVTLKDEWAKLKGKP
jgi:glutaminyl-tRNA synthetase